MRRSASSSNQIGDSCSVSTRTSRSTSSKQSRHVKKGGTIKSEAVRGDKSSTRSSIVRSAADKSGNRFSDDTEKNEKLASDDAISDKDGN